MKSCTTGKRSYLTYELAEEALIGANINFNTEKGPVGIYQCEDCGQFHLTSKGAINKRLEQMQKEGEIQKQKEAKWWEEKFKRG
jgi:hypothetical protein